MADPKPLASLWGVILRKGDTIEAHKRLRRNTGIRHLLWSQGVAMAFEGATSFNEQPGVLYAGDVVSYPVAGLATALLAAGTYGLSRVVERRRVDASESRQRTARELLGEPVDIVRITAKSSDRWLGFRRKERSLAVRWYGLEREGEVSSPQQAVRGLRRILAATEGTDVDAFVFGSRMISELVDVKSGRFGKIVDASEHSRTKKVEIADARADDSVLVASREQCTNLLSELAIAGLVAIIRERDSGSAVPEAAKSVDLVTGGGLKRLVGVLEQEIATDELSSGNYKLWGDDGFDIVRTRGSSVVMGDLLQTNRTYTDERGIPRNAPGTTQSLLGRTGHGSLDELLIELGRRKGIGVDASVAKIALLLTSRQLAKTIASGGAVDQTVSVIHGGDARVIALPPVSPPTTLFERLAEHPPRTALRLGRRVRGDSGLEFRRLKSSSRVKRYAKGAALTLLVPAAMYTASYNVGVGVNGLAESTLGHYEQLHAAELAGETIDPDVSVSEYLRERNPGAARFLDGMDKLRSVRSTLDEVGLEVVDRVGVPEELVSAVQAWITGGSEPTHVNGAYATDDGRIRVGDVPIRSEEDVFKIKPIDGASTDGYWYTKVNNLVEAHRGVETYPYSDLGVSFSSTGQSWEAPTSDGMGSTDIPVSPPADAKVRYEMTATFSRAQLPVSPHLPLAIKSGTAVVAAELRVGSGDTGEPIPVRLARDSKTGTYTMFITTEMAEAKASKLTLRYWLATDPSQAVRASGPMYVNLDSSQVRFDNHGGQYPAARRADGRDSPGADLGSPGAVE